MTSLLILVVDLNRSSDRLHQLDSDQGSLLSRRDQHGSSVDGASIRCMSVRVACGEGERSKIQTDLFGNGQSLGNRTGTGGSDGRGDSSSEKKSKEATEVSF